MVARGASAAGPVLLACRQWDPLGLARRLPSLGAGAWRSAPLLPWRVQCPVCVCAALAAGSGGSGRYLVLCLSRFPLPASPVPRCVWQAVPSGCHLPSLAGTPFHAVCAFRALGPVALLVVPACPFRVCALALPWRPLPPPRGGVACATRVVLALGAGRAVPRGPCPSACPAPVPCSVSRAWGGVVRSRFPPTWLGVVGVAVGRRRGGCLLLLRGASGVRCSPSPDCPPTGRAVGVRDPRVPGAGVRVWGPFSVPSACTPCGGCAPRGGSVAFVCRGTAAWGPVGRGVALPRSVPLPSLGRQQSGCHWRRAVHGGRGLPYHSGSCSPAFSGRDLWRALARWRGLACSPRPPGSWRLGRGGRSRSGSSLGRGGDHPPCLRGWGPGPLRLAGRWGGGGGGGGSRRGRPAPLLGGGLRYSILAPLVSSAHSLLACACGRGCSAAPGWGGVRGGPWTAPPGAPADLNPPPALPEWAVVTGGSCEARPPYCSVARVAPARWRGLAPRPRPPREQAQPHPPPPPPPRRGPFWGGASSRLRGGGGPLLWLPSWGGCGGGGGVYSCRGGCLAAADVGRGSVGGGGGGTPRPGSRPRLPRAVL